MFGRDTDFVMEVIEIKALVPCQHRWRWYGQSEENYSTGLAYVVKRQRCCDCLIYRDPSQDRRNWK